METGWSGETVLNNNLSMPRLGLGLWGPREGAETELAVSAALEAGYRLFDSASVYHNEKSLGLALMASGLKREDYFVVGKIWNDEQGWLGPQEAMKRSLDNLGLGYFDLTLIHWPTRQSGLTWRALAQARFLGLTRSIGVANFSPTQLLALVEETGLSPQVWQMEIHPLRVRADLPPLAAAWGIQLMAYSPLARGRLKKNQVIGRIAQKLDRSFSQVILRWAWQRGLGVIPKSVKPDRIKENAQIFDFSLSNEDMTAITRLDQARSVLKPPFVFDEAGYVLASAQ
ncbi:MAG: aldo/keto reductase [Deltaproteobacteria bacterium]|nr:aldo/keto reductase [Deltaproteobacteria bacterium]